MSEIDSLKKEVAEIRTVAHRSAIDAALSRQLPADYPDSKRAALTSLLSANLSPTMKYYGSTWLAGNQPLNTAINAYLESDEGAMFKPSSMPAQDGQGTKQRTSNAQGILADLESGAGRLLL